MLNLEQHIKEELDRLEQEIDKYEPISFKDIEKFLTQSIRRIAQKIKEEVEISKEHFEANMLDGDKVEDCGKAMLSAESVWEYINDRFNKILGDIK